MDICFKKTAYISATLAIVVCCIILLIITVAADFDLIFLGKSTNIDIIKLHAASIIILTIILVGVGWLQLNNLNKTSRADFLLRIDNRYGSNEIIKARAIIQKLYRDASNLDEPSCEDIILQKISDGIKKIGKDDSDKACEKFSYLLNLLDFLETIAYFSRKDFVSVTEIDELLGNSLIFYYKIYKNWIYYRRAKYNNNSYYNELETLIEKIQAYQLKEKLSKI